VRHRQIAAVKPDPGEEGPDGDPVSACNASSCSPSRMSVRRLEEHRSGKNPMLELQQGLLLAKSLARTDAVVSAPTGLSLSFSFDDMLHVSGRGRWKMSAETELGCPGLAGHSVWTGDNPVVGAASRIT